MVFYTTKVNVVPEVLDKRVLGPLYLDSLASVKPYLHLMGMSSNANTVNRWFTLPEKELLTDAPEQVFTFFVSFDMITRNSFDVEFPSARFNLVKYSMLARDSNGKLKTLLEFTIDVVFDNISETTVAGEPIKIGTVKLVGYYRILEQPPVEFNPVHYNVLPHNPKNSDIIANIPGQMYKTIYTDKFGFEQLLSSQFLLLKVSNFRRNNPTRPISGKRPGQ